MDPRSGKTAASPCGGSRVCCCRTSRGHRRTREAGLEHLPDESFERYIERTRRHWHEAVVGHARHGVDLEQERAPGLVHHEVRAAPAFGADGGEGGEREVREMFL